MLTLFGKKKKDETDDKEAKTPSLGVTASETPQDSVNPAPVQSPSGPETSPVEDQSYPQSVTRTSPSPSGFRPPPLVPIPTEEMSLTKVLQSLLQDISGEISSGFPQAYQATPDFVPVRSTPPSRPMVIGHGKDEGDDSEEQGGKPSKLAPASPAGKQVQPQPARVQTPTPPMQPVPLKKEQPVDKAPEKPKQPEKPAKKEKSPPQSFDHIFQLTQGNLENPGLVIINGAAGSGRTTLCGGLSSNYMKMENPCLYLTYDQSPTELRDQMKKLGTDVAQYESQFRFILVDGYSSQSEAFSVEPYYVDQAFNLDSVQEALVRNSQIFIGDKIRVFFDSLDKLVEKTPGKDFAKGFGDLVSKMKEAGATFIVTVDMSELPKDVAGSLNDLADCVIDLSKDDSDPDGRQLKVQRLNHSSSKLDAETFEIDSKQGLIFV